MRIHRNHTAFKSICPDLISQDSCTHEAWYVVLSTAFLKSAIPDSDAQKVKATSEMDLRMELWNKTYVDSNLSSTNY